MPRRARLASLCIAALAALVVAGCGNKQDSTNLADTEGIYVTVDDLKYQIQISRILNPADPEDQGYLRGLPAGEEPAADEIWFGIFMRVENDSDQEHMAADGFKIVDTQQNEFEPVEPDPSINVFGYQPRPIAPGHLLPQPNAPASDNTIGGALVLFKVKVDSLYNRPLELEISSATSDQNAVIDIDV
jgi:hypothetical protein